MINESQLDTEHLLKLSEQIIQNIKSHSKVFSFKTRQVIFKEGFKPMGLFMVKKGSVKIYKEDDKGREIILYITKDGDVTEYMSLIRNKEYNYSASALEDSELYFLPKEIFFQLVEHSPEFMMKLTLLFLKKVDVMIDRFVDVVSKRVRQRVAETLLTLCNDYGAESEYKKMRIIFSKEDISNRIATNPQTLTRVLGEFKKEKILRLDGDEIAIISSKRLSRAMAL